jgi:hypothetical protein
MCYGYSTSIVDKVIMGYRLLLQEMAPPPLNILMQLNVFFARFNIIHNELKPCKLLKRNA